MWQWPAMSTPWTGTFWCMDRRRRDSAGGITDAKCLWAPGGAWMGWGWWCWHRWAQVATWTAGGPFCMCGAQGFPSSSSLVVALIWLPSNTEAGRVVLTNPFTRLVEARHHNRPLFQTPTRAGTAYHGKYCLIASVILLTSNPES